MTKDLHKVIMKRSRLRNKSIDWWWVWNSKNILTNNSWILLKKLGILTEKQTMYSAANQLSEVEMAVIKYKIHPSIKAINDKMEKLGKPIFNLIFNSQKEIEKEVNNLKIKKASQKSDIPLKRKM